MTSQRGESIYFDFYGLGVRVNSLSAEVLEEVRRDFAYFSTDGQKRGLELTLHLEAPSFESLPPAAAAFYTPRNVCFRDGKVSYIDYFGRALAIRSSNGETCEAYSLDPDLIHEIAYHFLLSSVGQYLDKKGLHRIHALCVSRRGRGILLVLPSGGGKSTMALTLMKVPGVVLLGEETPLIDRRGYVLPFPLRLGVRPDEALDVPPQYTRIIERMEFDPKKVIDIEAFRDKLGGRERVRPEILLVGERNLGDVSEIVPCSRLRTFKTLVKNMIVGIGIYQGLEFLLDRSAWEIVGKFGVVSSRTYNTLQLMSRAKAYRFILGRDREKNRRTLLDFLDRQEP
jgi:hypothetical protein